MSSAASGPDAPVPDGESAAGRLRTARDLAGERRSWFLLVAGLVAIVLLLGTDTLRDRSMLRDLAYLVALADVRHETAVAHLRLDELVSGDDAVEAGEVMSRLQQSLQCLEIMTSRRPAGAPAPELRPLEDDELVRRVRELERRLVELLDLADRRIKGSQYGLAVGVGSPMDRQLDAAFAEISVRAFELQRSFEARMHRRRRGARALVFTVALTGTLLLVVSTLGLLRRRRRHRHLEEALRASQEQILRSQKLEAVGRIAGGLAHDINNYMAAIRGHCELVRMKSTSQRTTRKMDAVIRTVVKASSLIERLLAFGHQQPVQLEVVNLNRVITGLERILRPSIGDDVRVRTRLAENLWNVEVDVSQIEQVLVNLTVNAREAMPRGGEIVLETTNVEPNALRRYALAAAARPPAGAVLVSISDTGRGIAPEERDKIFDPFWTTKKDSGNSGLGLATVDHVVRVHGGWIELESEPGRGTTFRIFLPRSTKTPIHSALDEGDDQALYGHETILLVDDNPDFRESSRLLLEALGYRVVAAADAEQALELFDRLGEDIDLLLSDVVMPGSSGPQLLEEIRQRRALPAIFMSGYNEDVVLRHGIERGEVDFIKKQFSSAELARRLREVLDREPVNYSS